MLDFLILYEHKNREIENCCLLAAELESRGYSTKIVNIYSGNKYWLNPSVVLVPHLYDENQLLSFCDNYRHNNYKVLSLQYEQILRDNQHNGMHNPKGEAAFAQHIAWGMAQKNRYLEHGIKDENIHVTGHIGMDLDRKEFDKYFLTRDAVAKETGLDINKKWILFISTFGFRLRTKEDLDAFSRTDPTVYQTAELSNKAQDEIEKWLVMAAQENPDAIFIYRRHPSEREDPRLLQLEKEIPNFRCIDAFTIRQWVRCSTQLYTWYSTSIADAYYANRICHILRPYEVPKEFELDIMHGSNFVKSYDAFRSIVLDGGEKENSLFPISDEVMEYYYGHKKDSSEWSYKLVADTCVYMLNNKDVEYKFNYKRMREQDRVSLIVKLKCFIMHIMFNICTVIDFNFKLKNSSSRFFHNLNKYSKECYGMRSYVKETKRFFSEIIHSK